MKNVDKLFDLIRDCDYSRVILYKYRMNLIYIIYLCLKYRYCYQIGLNQSTKWIKEIEWYAADYCPETLFYGDSKFNIDFFVEGESLKKIFNDVVHFMEYKGYHDIPEDLYKCFTRDNIAIVEDDKCKVVLRKSWIEKYARGKVIKKYLSEWK